MIPLSPAEGALRFRARQEAKVLLAPIVERAKARALELAAQPEPAPTGSRSRYGMIRCACGTPRPPKTGRRPWDWKCEACR